MSWNSLQGRTQLSVPGDGSLSLGARVVQCPASQCAPPETTGASIPSPIQQGEMSAFRLWGVWECGAWPRALRSAVRGKVSVWTPGRAALCFRADDEISHVLGWGSISYNQSSPLRIFLYFHILNHIWHSYCCGSLVSLGMTLFCCMSHSKSAI